MDEQSAVDALKNRTRIAGGRILHFKEARVDPHVSADTAAELRRIVLNELNALKDLALDMLGTGAGPKALVVNQLWLDEISGLIEDIHQQVVVPAERRAEAS